MRVMVDTYNAYRSNYRTTGTEDPTLRDKYDRLFRDVLRQVQGTYVSAVASSAAPDAASPTGDQSGGGGGSGAAGGAVAGGAGKHNHEVISVMQLKAGIETAMRLENILSSSCFICLRAFLSAESMTAMLLLFCPASLAASVEQPALPALLRTPSSTLKNGRSIAVDWAAVYVRRSVMAFAFASFFKTLWRVYAEAWRTIQRTKCCRSSH